MYRTSLCLSTKTVYSLTNKALLNILVQINLGLLKINYAKYAKP